MSVMLTYTHEQWTILEKLNQAQLKTSMKLGVSIFKLKIEICWKLDTQPSDIKNH